MAAKKFIVELDTAERERLTTLISKGKAPAKTILKARILLKADVADGGPGWLDAEIVEPKSHHAIGPRHIGSSGKYADIDLQPGLNDNLPRSTLLYLKV